MKKLFFFQKAVAASFLVISACHAGGTGETSSTENQPIDHARAYRVARPLPIFSDILSVRDSKSDTVVMKGLGHQHAYVIEYAFNSGRATRIGLMKTHVLIETRNCSDVPSVQLFLRSGNETSAVTSESVTVKPYTAYILEVSLGTERCDSVDLTFGLLAYVTTSISAPSDVAITCVARDGMEFTTFPNRNLVTSNPGNRTFVSEAVACGTSIPKRVYLCSKLVPDGDISKISRMTCQQGVAPDERFFTIVFDSLGNAKMNCTANGSVTFSASLTQCRVGVP